MVESKIDYQLDMEMLLLRNNVELKKIPSLFSRSACQAELSRITKLSFASEKIFSALLFFVLLRGEKALPLLLLLSLSLSVVHTRTRKMARKAKLPTNSSPTLMRGLSERDSGCNVPVPLCLPERSSENRDLTVGKKSGTALWRILKWIKHTNRFFIRFYL